MILLALLIGIVAGLRALAPLAAVAWMANRGSVPVQGTWLAIVSWRYTAPVLTLLALAELVTDQLPSTPSRKVPVQFGTRLVSGGVSGAAVGLATGEWRIGLLLGLVGAVIGTFGGAAARARLAAAFGRDLPAALLEDAVAIGGALIVVAAF
jgi:uncharacterized membrane protein